jgi:hypothetical protein
MDEILHVMEKYHELDIEEYGTTERSLFYIHCKG